MDREKVIKGFKECMGEGRCTKCVYGKETPMISCKELLWDALALLQEQKAVVHCKDCKWRGTEACFCKAKDDVKDDWFCSEGEKAVSE